MSTDLTYRAAGRSRTLPTFTWQGAMASTSPLAVEVRCIPNHNSNVPTVDAVTATHNKAGRVRAAKQAAPPRGVPR
jgi:hypothetical protein